MQEIVLDDLGMRELGGLRLSLLEQLRAVETHLHARMIAARESGAKWQEIVNQSGYSGVQAVRNIVVPAVRDTQNSGRRARRASA